MSACRVTLTPIFRGSAVERLDVQYEIDGLERQAGQDVFTFQRSTVSVPAAELTDVSAWDDRGPLPLTVRETKPYPLELLHWQADRAVQGRLTIRYSALPGEKPSAGRHGPYFHFSREAGGAAGPGIAFLTDIPDWQGKISLHWDVSGMPEGTRAVCAWGEGDVNREGSLDDLRQIYYAFGPLHAITEGDFGMYWLDEPAFDAVELADFVKHLYGIMRRFFRDDQTVYRIFMSHDRTVSSGGTALRRCYMFGWNDTRRVSVAEKQNLLAHEMVHNWPHLNDEPYGETTWYEEGTAEYYSIMIPLRAGLITKEQALSEIQKRTGDYYTNPTRNLSDLEAAKICWQDRRAQRLSYGRGIFFLANVDARIRRATAGQKSVDDVVLSLLDMGRRNEALGNEAFLRVVRETAGIDVSEAWRLMHEGGHFAPDGDSFDSLFTVTPITAQEADTGKEAVSYQWAIR